MAIERKIKVSLEKFTASWKDSFVMFKAPSSELMKDYRMEVAKDIKKIQRRSKQLEGVTNKIDRAYAVGDEPDKELLDKEEKLEDEIVELGDKVDGKVVKFLSDQLLGGKIYDSEKEELRKITAEDFKQFDEEVRNYLVSNLSGQYDKKK